MFTQTDATHSSYFAKISLVHMNFGISKLSLVIASVYVNNLNRQSHIFYFQQVLKIEIQTVHATFPALSF